MEAGWHSAGNHTEPDLNSNEMAAQLGFILSLLPPAAAPASHPRPAACGAWGGLAGVRPCSASASRVQMCWMEPQ